MNIEKPTFAEKVISPEHRKHLSKTALTARLAGVLLALAALGAPAAVRHHIDFGVENTPAGIMQDILNIPYEYRLMYNMWQRDRSINEQLDKATPIPAVFENNGDQAVMKVGVNVIPATSEDLTKVQDNIVPSVNEKENGLPALPQFILLNPFKLQADDTISVSLVKTQGGFDSVTGKMVEAPRVFNLKFIVSAQGREIIPGIIDPKATSIEVFKNPPLKIEEKDYFGGVTLLITRQDGSKYTTGFSSLNDVRSLVPLPILDNAPDVKDMKDLLSKKGLAITGTTPIMKTGIPNAMVDFSVMQNPSATNTDYSGFSGVQLLESPDGKVLYIAGQP